MIKSFKYVPVIDEMLCTGCAACVEVCTPRSLELVNGKAVLVHPDTCGSEEHCIAPCQFDAIRMDWVGMRGNVTVGKWRLETWNSGPNT